MFSKGSGLLSPLQNFQGTLRKVARTSPPTWDVNSVQKRRRLLWARMVHLGWTITQWKRVLWSDESVFQVFFGRNGRRVLRTKEEKDHPDCYQQQVQKPGSVMVWGVSVPLAKVTCTSVMAPLMLKVHRDFGAQYAAFKKTSFPGTSMHISTKTMQNHILHTLQSPGCGGRGYGYLTDLPAVPTCLQQRMCGAF